MRRKILIVIDILLGAATIVLVGCKASHKTATNSPTNNAVEENKPEKKRYTTKTLNFAGGKTIVARQTKSEEVVVKEEEKEAVVDTTNMLQEVLVEAEYHETRGSYCAYGPPTPRN